MRTNRRGFLKAAGLTAGAAVMHGVTTAAGAKDQTITAGTPLLRPHWDGMASKDEWPARRAKLLEAIERHLGKPTPFETVRPTMRVLSESTTDDYRQLKVSYEVEPGEEVRAWLLIPPASRRRQGAAVLCLHGTSPEAKDTQLGAGTKLGRDYGRFLARHGFVTFSPDHCCSGERLPTGVKPYDSSPFYARHPDWSMVGKAAWDARRALDVLEQVDDVDPTRLGAVGHSLGGQGAAFVAAFDERVRAAVSSCGLTSWSGNPNLPQWSREEWYVYFPHLKPYIRDSRPLPFDLYEFAALAAPRAFLNISGMTDPTYGPNDRLPTAYQNLQRLYEVLEAPASFASFLPGMGHDVPRYSQTLTAGWLETFLLDGAA